MVHITFFPYTFNLQEEACLEGDTESDPEEEESEGEMVDDEVCDPNASKSPMSAVDTDEESGESESEECLDPALMDDRNPDDLPDTHSTESGTTLILPGVKRTVLFPPTPPADEPMTSDDEDQEGGGAKFLNNIFTFGDGAKTLTPL